MTVEGRVECVAGCGVGGRVAGWGEVHPTPLPIPRPEHQYLDIVTADGNPQARY